MLTPKRKGSDYHHGQLRESAILVARELIETGGMNALGIRKIASRLKVTPASLYRHFESFEELQNILGERFRNEMADFMISKRDQVKIKSSKLKLRTIGSAYIDFAAKNPRLFEAAFTYCDPKNLESNSDRAWQVLLDGVNELKGRQLPGIEMILWSSVHGLSTLFAQGSITKPQLNREKKLILDGLGRLLK